MPDGAIDPKITEILVSAAVATRVDPDPPMFRKSIEVLNLGPNTIWIAPGSGSSAPAALVANKCRRLVTGEGAQYDLSGGRHIWAIAETADQVTGAATVVTEI